MEPYKDTNNQINHKNDYVKDYNKTVHYGEAHRLLEEAPAYSQEQAEKMIGQHSLGPVQFFHLPNHDHVILQTIYGLKENAHKIEYGTHKGKRTVILRDDQLEKLTKKDKNEK